MGVEEIGTKRYIFPEEKAQETELFFEALNDIDARIKDLLTGNVLAAKAIQDQQTCSVKVENDLDRVCTIQIFGNHESSTTKADTIGASFGVASNGIETKTLEPSTSGWLPFLYLSLKCAAATVSGSAPTSGSITTRLVRSADEAVLLADALEIRDTNTHTPDTDPGKIFIRRW